MTAKKTQILDDSRVKQILKRIAYQVYENNFNETELIITGIEGNGYVIASMLAENISAICRLKLKLVKISVNKKDPSESSTQLHSDHTDIENKNILIVDDVLNSGRTMFHAFLPLIKARAKKIHTMALVDRDYKEFPIRADFIGISLSTTMQEHVEVVIEKNKVSVFLS
ncbi:MAG: phosphoribosyltransferase family protein [Bacteroidia bacterium]